MSKKFHELADDDYEHKSKKLNGKTVYFKSAVSEMAKQEFENLSDKDCEFIFGRLLLTDKILKNYSAQYDLNNLTATILDEVIDLWNHNPAQFEVNESEFINCIGSAFGHYLNKAIGTKWLLVTDEYGTDFCCQIDAIKLRAFPLNSVSKAIHQKREGSLEDIYLLIKMQKEELERDNSV